MPPPLSRIPISLTFTSDACFPSGILHRRTPRPWTLRPEGVVDQFTEGHRGILVSVITGGVDPLRNFGGTAFSIGQRIRDGF